jgi:hypothetical protein
MAPVFELLPLEVVDDWEGDDADSGDGGVVVGGVGPGVVAPGGLNTVAEKLPVAPEPEGAAEPPINWPGPISGVSKKRKT